MQCVQAAFTVPQAMMQVNNGHKIKLANHMDYFARQECSCLASNCDKDRHMYNVLLIVPQQIDCTIFTQKYFTNDYMAILVSKSHVI